MSVLVARTENVQISLRNAYLVLHLLGKGDLAGLGLSLSFEIRYFAKDADQGRSGATASWSTFDAY